MIPRIESLPMGPGVAATVHALMHAAYQDEAALIGATDFPPLARSLRDVAEAGTAFLGAWHGDTLQGVVELADHEAAPVIVVHSLCVARAARRLGIGRALIGHVQALAGSRPVKAATAMDNHPALELYRTLGFERVAETVSREGIGLAHMRWSRAAAEAGP